MSILITGATSGLGEELARQLQGKAKLLLTGRNVEKLHSLKTTLFGVVECLPCDLASTAQPLLEWIDQEKPQLIFNNAGFGIYSSFCALSDQNIAQMIEVNCTALSQITRHAIYLWKEAKVAGCVMNISSVAGFIPMPFSSLYAATKAFVTHLSRSLDLECAQEGIRVLAACPGMVRTNFSSRAAGGKLLKRDAFAERFLMMEADHAVRRILRQVEKKWPVRSVDWRYRMLHGMCCMLPSRVIGRQIGANLQKRLDQNSF